MDIKSYTENVFGSLGSVTFVKLDWLYRTKGIVVFILKIKGIVYIL